MKQWGKLTKTITVHHCNKLTSWTFEKESCRIDNFHDYPLNVCTKMWMCTAAITKASPKQFA